MFWRWLGGFAVVLVYWGDAFLLRSTAFLRRDACGDRELYISDMLILISVFIRVLYNNYRPISLNLSRAHDILIGEIKFVDAACVLAFN